MTSIARALAARTPQQQRTFGPSPTQRLALALGQTQPGNIDLKRRPVVHNLDGSISTVRSITVTQGKSAYLIPTVVGKRVVSNQQAVQHWQKTGQHLGAFNSEKNADRYAQTLHESQAKQYLPKLKQKPVARRGKPLV